MKKFKKSDVGRGVSFEGFDGELYKGFLDKVETTELGYAYIAIEYRVPGIPENIRTLLSDPKHFDRVNFLCGPGERQTTYNP